LERIIAAEAREEKGGKVRPAGQAPAGMKDGNDEVDSGGKSSLFERMSPEYLRELEVRDQMFGEMATQHCEVGPTGLYATCRLCSTVVEDDLQRKRTYVNAPLIQVSDVVEHFWQEYDRGWKLYEHFLTLEAAGCPDGMLADARRAYATCRHLTFVWTKMREDRAAKMRATKAAKIVS